ncbi:MAG: hypothetical protein OIF50_08730 [Flavobacteriaceae bacterium]|nr:hypothetical protein [Flavobacteriaceae bacterium]
MTIAAYIELLQKPDSIEQEEIAALNNIIETYPFFQSARVLHLKGLKKAGSFKYNSALRSTAAHTTDRNVLFDFISSRMASPSAIREIDIQEETILDKTGQPIVVPDEPPFPTDSEDELPELDNLQTQREENFLEDKDEELQYKDISIEQLLEDLDTVEPTIVSKPEAEQETTATTEENELDATDAIITSESEEIKTVENSFTSPTSEEDGNDKAFFDFLSTETESTIVADPMEKTSEEEEEEEVLHASTAISEIADTDSDSISNTAESTETVEEATVEIPQKETEENKSVNQSTTVNVNIQLGKQTDQEQSSNTDKETFLEPSFDLSGEIEPTITTEPSSTSGSEMESLSFDLPKKVIITEEEKDHFIPQNQDEADLLLDPDLYHQKTQQTAKETSLPETTGEAYGLSDEPTEEEDEPEDVSADTHRAVDDIQRSISNAEQKEKQAEQSQVEKTTASKTTLDFDPEEKYSFSEWIQLASTHPSIRRLSQQISTQSREEEENRMSKLEEKMTRIDMFLEANPKIAPPKKSDSSENLARKNQFPKEELMTETLAKVYLDQQKYKKAIQAYKILSLKYPEKSSFFADRIKAIKQLQQNK